MAFENLKALVAAADNAREIYDASHNANLSEEETHIARSNYLEAVNELTNAIMKETGGKLRIEIAAHTASRASGNNRDDARLSKNKFKEF